MTIRPADPTDLESAAACWRSATIARRDGRPLPPEAEARTRRYLAAPDAFVLVANDDGRIVGIGVGMQGRADDGAGPPVAGLCHVAMICVVPERWGCGIGRRIVDATLDTARTRGFERAQLWTQADNVRAQRLYEGRGFVASGREKRDELGEPIRHYTRAL